MSHSFKQEYERLAADDPVLWGAYCLRAKPMIYLLEDMKKELTSANFKLESTIKDIEYLIQGIKYASRNTEAGTTKNDGEGSG